MHLDHEHEEHTHSHEHPHTHADGTTHTHSHEHAHSHEHTHAHSHEHVHEDGTVHTHSHDCSHDCHGCPSQCEHTPMEELTALMKYMVGHNAAHTRELAELAGKLDQVGNHMAYEQVMAAVSDFEKGNMRLSVILSSLSEG